MNTLLVEIENNLSVEETGGKGNSLNILATNGFNVPKGFVVTYKAFFEFLKCNGLTEKIEKLAFEIDKVNFKERSKEIRDLILRGRIPNIVSEIRNHLNSLNAPYVSVRSSAISEDSLKASFAGLFDTFLNIKAELPLILENVKKCWASLFNERAVAYRITKRMPHLEGMAVVIQEMISAEISGVTFTVHPLDAKSLLIETSYGIGDIIVSGKVEPDDYVVDREKLKIGKKRIGRKSRMSIVKKGSIEIVDTEKELAEKQVLSDDKIKKIAKTCLKVEKTFNYPQNIEWCISNNKLWLLQSRPITGTIR